MLQAGRMDRQIQLLSPQYSEDEYGSTNAEYAPVVDGKIWAQKRELRGQEQFTAMQVTNEVPIRFRIRYRDDIEEDWRVQFDDNEYDIKSIVPIGSRREGLELTCERVTTVG